MSDASRRIRRRPNLESRSGEPRRAKQHRRESHKRKWLGVGGVREDLEFQAWLIQLGMRYLTGGSDVGYILSAGRADVQRIRTVPLS